MRWSRSIVAGLVLIGLRYDLAALRGDQTQVPPEGGVASGELIFSCAPDNDVYKALLTGGAKPSRYETPEVAIGSAGRSAGVLILAEDYPATPVRVSNAALQEAAAKELRLYIEYAESLPDLSFGPPRPVHWERAVVASPSIKLGLPRLSLLALHDCKFRPTAAADPALVLARVAGFNTAVYGLPKDQFPLLFKTADGVLVSTTKLSNFNTARYAPAADWRTIWQHILAEVNAAGAPHELALKPTVRPAFGKHDALPAHAEELALSSAANWLKTSRLLLSKDRADLVRNSLQAGTEEISLPGVETPTGDGSWGVLEGYASRIDPNGNQPQRLPIRADCQAESAAVLALHAMLTGDDQSREIAENLLNFLYFKSELHQGVRGDPRHPAFGLIGWGAHAPAWQTANYGDDNARTLLATMAAAASLNSEAWNAPMLKGLLANLRTTGRLGFRGDRIDIPPLRQHGWKHFHDADTVNLSPHFEAYLWACYLWAFAQTGEQEFLDKTKIAIRMTMEAYPKGWRWGENIERGHMLLALAWLVRVEDHPEHRRWLKRIADDILADQQPCGAIAERVVGAGAGHYVVPASNEAYGTTETPLIQRNGDPVSDQLYTTGFVLLGLHEAAAATGDRELLDAENRLADYLVRIQVRSDAIPYLNGAWFRAFDYGRWDYWASSADMGWGAWCVESGWGPAWNAIVFGLRAKNTSLWDLTAASTIERNLNDVRKLMAENDGQPWRP